MIAAQREALEDARRSREDALKATKARGPMKHSIVIGTTLLCIADQKQFLSVNEP